MKVKATVEVKISGAAFPFPSLAGAAAFTSRVMLLSPFFVGWCCLLSWTFNLFFLMCFLLDFTRTPFAFLILFVVSAPVDQGLPVFALRFLKFSFGFLHLFSFDFPQW